MKSSPSLRVAVLAILVFVSVATVASAQSSEDFSLRIAPVLEVPLGARSRLFDDNAEYGLGGSFSLSGQFILPNTPFVYVGGGLNLQATSTPGTAPTLAVASLGLESGANIRLGNTLSLQAGVEAGWYVGFFGEAEPGTNPFAGAAANLGWDLSPGFSLNAGLGYRYHLAFDADGSMTDLIQGARVSIGTVFRPRGNGERTRVDIRDVQFAPVFPVFYGYYDENSLGTVTVHNGENSAITDVKVYFNVNEYMEQPKLSAEIPVMQRGEDATVDLHALFRSSVLNINTDTLVQSQIITEYTYLGETFTREMPHTLRIHGRNSMTWDDDRKAACFVNPKDPTVLLFSKNTAGLIREESNPINLNLRIAMGIFEALRAYGMSYVVDPDSSYIELSEQANALDTLLFPSESLTYRAGDCDDLSILYASLLESVGIETAFVTIPGHIYMAFNLDMTEEEADAEFTDLSDFMFIDDQAWVPVEITLVSDGFMRAWRTGAREWRDAVSKGTAALLPLHEAWVHYETAPTQTPPLSLVFPSSDVILAGYQTNLQEFIDREVSENLQNFHDRISQRGDNAIIRNRLGVLYARYGMYDEAQEQFQLSVLQDNNYVAPMVNLGNISYLREQLPEALDWYQRAERFAPDSSAILAGLARTQYELEQYEGARSDYNRLAQQDPDAASEYAYIGDQSGAVGRASAAQDRGRTLWEDSGDEEW